MAARRVLPLPKRLYFGAIFARLLFSSSGLECYFQVEASYSTADKNVGSAWYIARARSP